MERLISVIVPIYNGEKYLEDALKSILQQTFKDFELLLIDDGSTDLTPQICDRIAETDSRIVVVHQKNKGVSAARNEGLKRAVGQYICFVDGDDYIKPEMLEILYNNAREFDVDISCCGIVQRRLDGKCSNKFCTGEKIYITDKKILIEKFFSNPIYKEVLYGPVNKLIKSDLAKAVLFNENFKIGEDLLFGFECIEKMNSFYFENKGLYYYIKRKDSATTSAFSVKRFDYIYIADILLKKCEETHIDAYNNALYWTFLHKQNMCRSLCKYPKIKKEYKAFFEECFLFCKKNRKKVWKRLPMKKKIDYIALRCVPFLYKII